MKEEKQIWQKSQDELFSGLNCGEEGLSSAEAKARLEKYGPNKLKEGEKHMEFYLDENKAKELIISLYYKEAEAK